MTKGFVVVLDDVAGSIFKLLHELSKTLKRNLKKWKDVQNVIKASGKAVTIIGAIENVFQIVSGTQIVNFLGLEQLVPPVILGSHFYDLQVKVIKQRLTVVKLDDGSTVPIIPKQSKESTNVPRSDEK